MKYQHISRGPLLGEDLAREMRQSILREGLKDGDKLPTEKVLCERYGVSRTVVREAIARLKNEGIIVGRQGAGTFIAKPRGHGIFRLISGSQMREHFQSVAELRLGVEVVGAGLAAERRTKADVARLKAAFAAMANPETRSEADIAFHIAVASATKNPLYESFVGFLSNELSGAIAEAVRNTMMRRPQEVAGVLLEHQKILDAIERSDPVAAKLAMETHLKSALARMTMRLKRDTVQLRRSDGV
jgi:GntR family transcriptional regulator, transcriptional repressor for pyruvate dehydrogenase complex